MNMKQECQPLCHDIWQKEEMMKKYEKIPRVLQYKTDKHGVDYHDQIFASLSCITW
jgi:hypothetical protein